MTLCVSGLEPGGLYPSVNLSRRDGRVAQELLDRAEVGAALEQLRRERVAQRVGRDAALHLGAAGPGPQPGAHVGRRQAPPGPREKERRLAVAVLERRAGAFQVVRDRPQRRLPRRNDPRLAALALDAQLLAVEVDGRHVEGDELLGAQA